MKHKILSFILVLALCCGLMPAVFAAAENERQPLPETTLYFGTVENILPDDDGNMKALRLSSERYGGYVMNLSDETVWIDSGRKTVSDKSTLTEGESVYVFHSTVSTRSMPPQSRAFAVVRNVPQDAGSAQYMKINSIEETDGVVTITANNGTKSFTVSDQTTYSPYRTRNIVTLKDLQAGSRVMVWYAFSTDAENLNARHIMLLPELEEDMNKVVTRSELMVMLHTAEGSPVVNYAMNFRDVAQNADYAEAIRWTVSEGLAAGYGDGRFGPDDPVNREQLAVILWRQAGSPMLMDYPGLTQYEDAGDISGFARQAMLWAHQKGLLDRESKTVEPHAHVTVSEVNAMLQALNTPV